MLLLTGAAASGNVFSDSADHVVPAVVQFLLSLFAAIPLARKTGDIHAAAVSAELPATPRS